ncbi:MAG TPA: sulfur oxidation c-type cytochrome SoxX [Gammaproteobacteria bacterium]|nr:sulfur oxidation c-type cytochrome SoxX [Gammaproteobacteria bacterium]
MRKIATLVTAAASIATLVGSLALLPTGSSIAAGNSASAVDQGKKLAFNRKKGNCLACHQIAGGNMAGNIGPPLVAMKARFPDKSKLRSQIWDATKANPNSAMPPFGRHKILSDKDIDKIVEYVYTL